MRTIKNAHNKDIIAGDYSFNLGMIASGSRDKLIKLWDFEKIKVEGELRIHTAEILIVRFLNPFPLIISSDSSGTLALWTTKPHSRPNQCLVVWRNMFTNDKAVAVNSLDYYYDEKANDIYLCLGDDMGHIRLMQLGKIIKDMALRPLELQLGNKKRNPWRILETNAATETNLNKSNMYEKIQEQISDDEEEDDEDCKSVMTEDDMPRSVESIPLYEDLYVTQVRQWKAHNDAIKSVIVIKETDSVMIFTAALDKMAKIWRMEDGELQGILKQGNQKEGKGGSTWDFPLGKYIAEDTERAKKIDMILYDARKKREAEQAKEALLEKTRGNILLNTSMNATARNIIDMNAASFDVDEDIESEVLASEEVFKDLKELEEILSKSAKNDNSMTGKVFRPKTKKHRK